MKTKLMRFFAEPDDNGGGSATDVLNAPSLGGETEPTTTETTPAAAPAFDAAAMASAFAGALKESGYVPPQPQQQKVLTPEEAKKLLNVWEPDDAFVQEFGNLDTQKAAFGKMRDFFIKQADTITQLRMQEFQQQMESRYAPVQQYVTEQQAVSRETRFNTSFPDLAKPELKPLLGSVIQGLAAQGALDPKDEGKTFKTIASAMEKVIQTQNPNFKLSPAGTTPTAKTNGNALRPTTGGSGGGGGGKSVDTSGKPRALSLL